MSDRVIEGLREKRLEVARGDLPIELRALAALVINMLVRHSHEERVLVLRFALEKEGLIPVNKTSVFSGTDIMRER